MKTYKFFMILENSLCEDHISEQVFNVMRNDIVPIVLGEANYSKYLPPNSFINVEDFKTVKSLGSHLNELSKNDDEYLQYFWWKQFYEVVDSHYEFCSLCERLHSRKYINRTQIYEDINE